MENQSKSEPTKGVTPNHIALYQKIASHSEKIFDVLFLLLDSRNENIRLGAAKVLANKILPDKKEITGEGGGPINVRIINDYLSEPRPDAPPEGSPERQDEIQGSGMA